MVIVLISVTGGRIVPVFTGNWLHARGIKPVPPSTDLLDRIALGVAHDGMIAWTFPPTWLPVGALLVVLHIGYLWLVVGVALLALSLITAAVPTAAVVYALTASAIGTMILAVMMRDTRPYRSCAARRPCDDADLRPGERIGGGARRCRLMGDGQMDLYEVAALAWVGAFALFIAVYGPMLLAPHR